MNNSIEGKPFNKYADGIKAEVTRILPEERVRKDWIINWERTMRAIADADGIFELISLICARWEFLGSLYRGNTDKTNYKDAIYYTSKFLVPINAHYNKIHNISGRQNARSDFFTMFRNKPLHGGTPAAVTRKGEGDIVSWNIGFDKETHTYHLQIREGRMHINGNIFLEEFISSLRGFADYLKENTQILDLDGHQPEARFKRAFWARFEPLHYSHNDWMSEGYKRGIPE